jgi:hypothetical protein
MFIGTGEEEDPVSLHPPVTGKDIGSNGGVGVPDMGNVVHIVDRRSDIEMSGHEERLPLLFRAVLVG